MPVLARRRNTGARCRAINSERPCSLRRAPAPPTLEGSRAGHRAILGHRQQLAAQHRRVVGTQRGRQPRDLHGREDVAAPDVCGGDLKWTRLLGTCLVMTAIKCACPPTRTPPSPTPLQHLQHLCHVAEQRGRAAQQHAAVPAPPLALLGARHERAEGAVQPRVGPLLAPRRRLQLVCDVAGQGGGQAWPGGLRDGPARRERRGRAIQGRQEVGAVQQGQQALEAVLCRGRSVGTAGLAVLAATQRAGRRRRRRRRRGYNLSSDRGAGASAARPSVITLRCATFSPFRRSVTSFTCLGSAIVAPAAAVSFYDMVAPRGEKIWRGDVRG